MCEGTHSVLRSMFYLKLDLKRGCLKDAHLFNYQSKHSPSKKYLCQHVN